MEKGSIKSINWGALALRGLIVNLFSVCFVIFPFVNFNLRVLFFSIFSLSFGALSLDAVIGFKMNAISLLELLQGTVSIIIGVITLSAVVDKNEKLVLLIATWAIIVGVLKYILYYAWGKDIPHAWLPKASGAMAILLGLFLLFFMHTEKNLMAVAVYLGAYTFVFGLLLLAFAMDIRAVKKESEEKW